jgi:hypothetical protein
LQIDISRDARRVRADVRDDAERRRAVLLCEGPPTDERWCA